MPPSFLIRTYKDYLCIKIAIKIKLEVGQKNNYRIEERHELTEIQSGLRFEYI
jgi:hypothetical protein